MHLAGALTAWRALLLLPLFPVLAVQTELGEELSPQWRKVALEDIPCKLWWDLPLPGPFSWACSFFSFHTRFKRLFVNTSLCLWGSGQKAREGSKRQQTVLRGSGVRLLGWRGYALQLIAVVAGVTYGTSRSQHYFMAPWSWTWVLLKWPLHMPR